MTTRKGTDRRLLQVSLKPDFYEQLRQHCSQLDMPMAIWVRELIKREIEKAQGGHPP
jgi:predicted DNA-binding protein